MPASPETKKSWNMSHKPLSSRHCFTTQIRVNQMITKSKNTWEFGRKRQKNNKLYCHLALNRDYEMAEHLSAVREAGSYQIQPQWPCSLNNNNKHKHCWLPKEYRVCEHCTTREVETEAMFQYNCHANFKILLKCRKKENKNSICEICEFPSAGLEPINQGSASVVTSVVDVTRGCNKKDVWVPNQKHGQVATSHVSARYGNIRLTADQTWVLYVRTYWAKVFPSPV